MDWKAPGDDEKFSLVVAADVTYDRTNIDPLLNALDKRLAAGGEAWFGDAGRGPAAEFRDRAVDRGWQVSLFDEHDAPTIVAALGRYQRMVLRRLT